MKRPAINVDEQIVFSRKARKQYAWAMRAGGASKTKRRARRRERRTAKLQTNEHTGTESPSPENS